MNHTQIGYSVVRLVVVDVIDLAIRPVPVINCPSDSMCKQFLIGYRTKQISV